MPGHKPSRPRQPEPSSVSWDDVVSAPAPAVRPQPPAAVPRPPVQARSRPQPLQLPAAQQGPAPLSQSQQSQPAPQMPAAPQGLSPWPGGSPLAPQLPGPAVQQGSRPPSAVPAAQVLTTSMQTPIHVQVDDAVAEHDVLQLNRVILHRLPSPLRVRQLPFDDDQTATPQQIQDLADQLRAEAKYGPVDIFTQHTDISLTTSDGSHPSLRLRKPMGISHFVPIDNDVGSRAWSEIHNKINKNGGPCCVAPPFHMDRTALYCDHSFKLPSGVVLGYHVTRHPLTSMPIDQLNDVAKCKSPPNQWTACSYRAAAKPKDHDVHRPEDNMDPHTYAGVVMNLLLLNVYAHTQRGMPTDPHAENSESGDVWEDEHDQSSRVRVFSAIYAYIIGISTEFHDAGEDVTSSVVTKMLKHDSCVVAELVLSAMHLLDRHKNGGYTGSSLVDVLQNELRDVCEEIMRNKHVNEDLAHSRSVLLVGDLVADASRDGVLIGRAECPYDEDSQWQMGEALPYRPLNAAAAVNDADQLRNISGNDVARLLTLCSDDDVYDVVRMFEAHRPAEVRNMLGEIARRAASPTMCSDDVYKVSQHFSGAQLAAVASSLVIQVHTPTEYAATELETLLSDDSSGMGSFVMAVLQALITRDNWPLANRLLAAVKTVGKPLTRQTVSDIDDENFGRVHRGIRAPSVWDDAFISVVAAGDHNVGQVMGRHVAVVVFKTLLYMRSQVWDSSSSFLVWFIGSHGQDRVVCDFEAVFSRGSNDRFAPQWASNVLSACAERFKRHKIGVSPSGSSVFVENDTYKYFLIVSWDRRMALAAPDVAVKVLRRISQQLRRARERDSFVVLRPFGRETAEVQDYK